MPDNDLVQFAEDMRQECLVQSKQEGEEEFPETIFTQLMLNLLGDGGEIEDAAPCAHRSEAAKLRINAWAENPDGDQIDLVVTLYTGETPPRTIYKEEMVSAFKQLREFLVHAFKGYHARIEESAQVFDAAQRLYHIKHDLTRIRLILLTDGIVKSDPPKTADLDERVITYQVWDIERLFRLWSSGRQQEPIAIDFEESLGYAIPCLPQPCATQEYNACLVIFPGQALAHLYGQYGSRLLERNVRSFLQAKGKINAGIRKTILKEPQMFLAYNNGLSMTAEAVDLVPLPSGGQGLKAVRDLQIVNGGQTTASIFYALKKDRADLSQVYVQAKLTVLRDTTRMDEIVPRISEYANSQNKIQVSDFAANDAYHREMEKLSRTIWAPARLSLQMQTHWYYERARGQYKDDLARHRQKEFQAQNPADQLFTKTDLAKFVQTWSQRPHIVSKGAQYCFSDFQANLEVHLQDSGPVTDTYFKQLIAKSILFRSAEQVMKRLKYAGYRANLVTYTLGRLIHMTSGRIDLDRIWHEQRISANLEQAIEDISRHTWDHITNPPGSGNVTQYCKQLKCWETFLEHNVPLPQKLEAELINDHLAPQNKSKPDRRPVSVREAMQVSAENWFEVASWGKRTSHLSSSDLDVLIKIAESVGYGREPSAMQAKAAMRLLKSARELGCRI